MSIHSYSEDTIKRAIEDVKVQIDFELPILAAGDKGKLIDLEYASYATIDHIYARLGLGNYDPYLKLAGVIRIEEEE